MSSLDSLAGIGVLSAIKFAEGDHSSMEMLVDTTAVRTKERVFALLEFTFVLERAPMLRTNELTIAATQRPFRAILFPRVTVHELRQRLFKFDDHRFAVHTFAKMKRREGELS